MLPFGSGGSFPIASGVVARGVGSRAVRLGQHQTFWSVGIELATPRNDGMAVPSNVNSVFVHCRTVEMLPRKGLASPCARRTTTHLLKRKVLRPQN